MTFKRKFDSGPPIHTVRMTNEYLLLLSDYSLEIVNLYSNQSTLFEDPTFMNIVAVTEDLVTKKKIIYRFLS